MKCVIQRVRRASVTVNDALVSDIGPGLLVLAAVEKGDGEQAMRDAARKIRELRIFSDDAGKMNRDVREAGGFAVGVVERREQCVEREAVCIIASVRADTRDCRRRWAP